MNSVVLFCFGAVIFGAVTTAAFLYGLALFRGFEEQDAAGSLADELLMAAAPALREPAEAPQA